MIVDRNIKGMEVNTPEIFRDHRGEFVEIWNAMGEDFVEDCLSVSKKNVLRGFHGENCWKLVQCLHGDAWLVVVDCRKDSPTHKNAWASSVNDENRLQVLVPPNCAIGHLCLSEKCLLHYKRSTYYAGADKQFTLKWDSVPGVIWPLWPSDCRIFPILSERDKGGLTLEELP